MSLFDQFNRQPATATATNATTTTIFPKANLQTIESRYALVSARSAKATTSLGKFEIPAGQDQVTTEIAKIISTLDVSSIDRTKKGGFLGMFTIPKTVKELITEIRDRIGLIDKSLPTATTQLTNVITAFTKMREKFTNEVPEILLISENMAALAKEAENLQDQKKEELATFTVTTVRDRLHADNINSDIQRLGFIISELKSECMRMEQVATNHQSLAKCAGDLATSHTIIRTALPNLRYVIEQKHQAANIISASSNAQMLQMAIDKAHTDAASSTTEATQAVHELLANSDSAIRTFDTIKNQIQKTAEIQQQTALAISGRQQQVTNQFDNRI